ncbi:hypothetical protein HN682_02820, partial [Candidatus Peregrinibacteria bacterium]|nr:hypothetical protein [Candidatus Peregrinibacteria bacterium]
NMQRFLNDQASVYFQDGGRHFFYVAGAAGADADITWTSALTIANNGDVTVDTGNLVIPTADKGISFTGGTDPDTSGTATGNILNDYEEGTFTIGWAGATFSSVSHTTAHYTKIGNMVYFHHYNNGMTISSTLGGATLTGLPFTSSSTTHSYGQFTIVYNNSIDGSSPGGYVHTNNTIGTFVDLDNNATASWINTSGAYIMVQGFYQV